MQWYQTGSKALNVPRSTVGSIFVVWKKFRTTETLELILDGHSYSRHLNDSGEVYWVELQVLQAVKTRNDSRTLWKHGVGAFSPAGTGILEWGPWRKLQSAYELSWSFGPVYQHDLDTVPRQCSRGYGAILCTSFSGPDEASDLKSVDHLWRDPKVAVHGRSDCAWGGMARWFGETVQMCEAYGEDLKL